VWLLALWPFVAGIRTKNITTFPRKHLVAWILVIAVGFIWARVSGAGGYGYQNWDWMKSNAVLKDLVSRPWPVGFSTNDGQIHSMVYYIAYYLPAALVGKILGWNAANHALFIYTFVGIALSLFWFVRLVGFVSPLLAIFFVLFGGLDFVAAFILSGRVFSGVEGMEYWTHIWHYSGNTLLLFFGPQHALAAWMLTGAIIREGMTEKSAEYIGFLLALCLLWSPLIVFGLVPIGLMALYESRLRKILTYQNFIAAALMFFLMALFFASNSFRMPKGWVLLGII
jgi:hypothetical protein